MGDICHGSPRRCSGLLFGVALALLAFNPMSGFAQSARDTVFINTQYAHLQNDITRMENQLYGHPYPDESTHKRMKRMENTLFGSSQPGTMENRYHAIQQKMKEDSASVENSTQDRTVEYLENRFFQKTFDDLPLETRLDQLEMHVFGKRFDRFPTEARIKKLTYTVPITAKEIRVSKDGKLVATTKPRNQKKVQSNPHDDYLDAVYRLPDARMLRWLALPTQVYVQSGTDEEKAIVQEAVTLWNGVYPIHMADSQGHADIVVKWDASSVPVRSLTRPVTHLNDSRQIRTVIAINMGPYKSHPRPSQLRGMLHQLGHASGIWGHSNDPEDVMYASHKIEASDFPEIWNRGVVRFSSQIPEPAEGRIPTRPSVRDVNTLTQIYSSPGIDIRMYAP